MARSLKAAVIGALIAAGPAAGSAHAQAIQCSTFLHNRDGSWTSFWDAVVLGSYGPVPIHTGERFRVGAGRAQDDVARILDHVCQPE